MIQLISFIKFWSCFMLVYYTIAVIICALQFNKQDKLEVTINGIIKYDPIGMFFKHMFKGMICASILYFF